MIGQQLHTADEVFPFIKRTFTQSQTPRKANSTHHLCTLSQLHAIEYWGQNIELAPGSFHTGSESVDKSECRQLGNAVGNALSRRSGRAGDGWPDGLRGGAP